MVGKTQDAGFRHPEAVAFLESLTEEEAKHPPLVREHDGVVTRTECVAASTASADCRSVPAS